MSLDGKYKCKQTGWLLTISNANPPNSTYDFHISGRSIGYPEYPIEMDGHGGFFYVNKTDYMVISGEGVTRAADWTYEFAVGMAGYCKIDPNNITFVGAQAYVDQDDVTELEPFRMVFTKE